MRSDTKKVLIYSAFVIVIALIALPWEDEYITLSGWSEKLTAFRKPLLVYIAMLATIYGFAKENEGRRGIPPTAWALGALIGITVIDIGAKTLAWLAVFTVVTAITVWNGKEWKKEGTNQLVTTIMAGAMVFLLHYPVEHVGGQQASCWIKAIGATMIMFALGGWVILRVGQRVRRAIPNRNPGEDRNESPQEDEKNERLSEKRPKTR